MSETTSRLSGEEIERYARHLVLPEIGGPGQQALKAARVAVIGAGGLGSPVILYLAAAGVGHLTLVDDDVVSLSNLQRQVVHHTASLGKSKAHSAASTAQSINPHVKTEMHAARLTKENAAILIGGKSVIIDGTDNFETRRLMAEVCEAEQVPLVTAAVNRFDGSLTTLMPWRADEAGKNAPRFGDLFPEDPPSGSMQTCEETGIIGAITGIMGCLQALEAIKIIAGAGEPLIGRLLMVDGLTMRFNEIGYSRREEAKS